MSNLSSAYDQDKKTQAQIEAIEKEIKLTQPLTSNLEPLSTLLDIYTKQDDQDSGNSSSSTSNFIKGSGYLTGKYNSWRRIRGDGNCYYRAFLYAICEKLLRNEEKDLCEKELMRLKQYAKSSIDEVTKHGYDEFTVETFHEELVDLLNSIGKNLTTSEALHEQLTQENATSDYCIWYLRVLTSTTLKKDPDRFIHFLDDPNIFDIETFCARKIDPMGIECDMVQVLALAEAFSIRVQIEYMDGREVTLMNPNEEGGGKKLIMHQFGPENSDCLQICLLYRPGHFDILYL